MQDAFAAIPGRFAEDRIPEGLISQLHAATVRFHEARCHLEEAMGDANYGHQSHIEETENELRRAERALEEINDRIRAVMKRSLTK